MYLLLFCKYKLFNWQTKVPPDDPCLGSCRRDSAAVAGVYRQLYQHCGGPLVPMASVDRPARGRARDTVHIYGDTRNWARARLFRKHTYGSGLDMNVMQTNWTWVINLPAIWQLYKSTVIQLKVLPFIPPGVWIQHRLLKQAGTGLHCMDFSLHTRFNFSASPMRFLISRAYPDSIFYLVKLLHQLNYTLITVISITIIMGVVH
jgi:hypothetical protein